MKKVHLVAACGVGMASLAGMLKERGFCVTGSDADVYPPMSDQLARLGIPLRSPYAAENIPPDADLVIVGNAVSRDNPECAEAVRRGLPMLSMPQALAEYFIGDRQSLVVAGTHGKTTTTALLAWSLFALGADPSFLVGGVPKNFPVSYRVGGGPYFVVEGDEYDTAWFDKGPKFLHYRPAIVLLTSIEFDHADIYRDLEHLKESFRRLVRLIPARGLLVACAEYPAVVEVSGEARCPVVFYRREPALLGAAGGACAAEGAPARREPGAGDRGPDGAAPPGAWIVRERKGGGEKGAGFSMERGGEVLSFPFPLPGSHNAANAAAAAIALIRLGFPPARIGEAFAAFAGVRRRQEVLGEFKGVLLVDDFAHHPTAVRETIRAVRCRWPGRRVIAVFEPRSNTSRRRVFQREFGLALAEADEAIVAGVFGAGRIPPGERLEPAAVVEAVRRAGREAEYVEEVDRIVERLVFRARPGDLILLMSNGGFGGIQGKLAAALSGRRCAP